MPRRPCLQRCVLALWGLGSTLIVACGGSGEPVGPNHACFRALDCEEGLVCVQGRCTSDIAPIVPEGTAAVPAVPSEPDAGGR